MKKYVGFAAPFAAAFMLSAFTAAGGAAAQSAADFYKNKQVKVIVGFGSGGGYSKYCFLLLRYLPAQVPGQPTMTCQFMSGGGGVKAANYMQNAGPRDGSVVGMLSDFMTVAQLLSPGKVKYDARQFTYLGVMVPANPVLMAWHTAPVKSLDALRKQQLVVGVVGKLGMDGINTSILNQFLDTRLKQVIGYKGTGPIAIAMEKGEVQASMSSWVSWKSRAMPWIQSGKVVPIVQVGLKKASDLPDVPLMVDLAKNEDDRKLLAFISGGGPFGRSLVAPPGVPQHLIAAFRTAFDKVMANPDFRADAKKRNIEIDPTPGAEIQPVVEQILSTPPNIVKRAQEALGIAG
jgi:tripartite-type tricarboxylate transporter receptor subunit TctC